MWDPTAVLVAAPVLRSCPARAFPCGMLHQKYHNPKPTGPDASVALPCRTGAPGGLHAHRPGAAAAAGRCSRLTRLRSLLNPGRRVAGPAYGAGRLALPPEASALTGLAQLAVCSTDVPAGLAVLSRLRSLSLGRLQVSVAQPNVLTRQRHCFMCGHKRPDFDAPLLGGQAALQFCTVRAAAPVGLGSVDGGRTSFTLPA